MKHAVRMSAAVLAVAVVAGCRSPNGLPKEYAAGLAMVTQKIADQGVLNDWASDATANLHDPGMESYVRVETAVGVRIAGMDGRFDLGTQGGGTQLPPGVRESLIQQLDGPISDQQRAAILSILGWNRTQAEAGTGAASGGGGS